MTKFFNPEDFKTIKYDEEVNGCSLATFSDHTSKTIAYHANRLIEQRAVRIYQTAFPGGAWFDQDSVHADINNSTHQALLINIEEIIQCDHPSEKVNYIPSNLNFPTFQCKCGKIVHPKSYEDLK